VTQKQTFTKPTHKQQNTKVAYVNARLFDPESGFDVTGSLLTDGDKIADFGENIDVSSATETIDCGGHLLTPGLLDIQVHFREPGLEYKETIESGSKSAAAGGVTTVVCMPNTKPNIDDPSIMDFINKKAYDTAYCNVRAYGAITKKQKGEEITEMSLLKDAGVSGFTDDGLPVMNSLVMRRAMEYCSMLDLPICQHAEDLNLSDGGCINEGAVSTKLGVKGVPNASEAIIVARDLLLLELVPNCHYHVLHISTHQAIDAVRQAKAKGLKVTCEAAPHHFILTDEAVLEYKTWAKMNPPLRAQKDIDAIIAGLQDGTIDAIATDHAPHENEVKNVPLSQAAFGIVGLETMLPLSLELVNKGLLSLRDVIGKMTYQAADIIREPAGRLQKGLRADLTLIDLNEKWTVSPEEFCSKSKNSPFDNITTTGRAIRTIVSGETVYTLK
jgi:dihydroorotase